MTYTKIMMWVTSIIAALTFGFYWCESYASRVMGGIWVEGDVFNHIARKLWALHETTGSLMLLTAMMAGFTMIMFVVEKHFERKERQ